MIRLFIIIFVLLFAEALGAQVTEEWIQRYNGTGSSFDIANSLMLDDTGNVYVTGTSVGAGSLSDLVIIKYNSSGNLKWAFRYNGPGNSSDELRSAAMDSAGNIYAAGYTADSNGGIHLLVIKVSNSGKLVWTRTYQPPDVSSTTAETILINSTGEILITGSGRFQNNRYVLLILKYSPSGSLVWEKTFNDNVNHIQPVSSALDNNDNLIAACNVSLSLTTYDILTIKYSTNGDTTWTKKFGSIPSDDKAVDIAIDSDNRIILAASTNVLSSSVNYLTLKYSANGSEDWNIVYDNGNIDIPYDINVDNKNNIYVTGSSRSGTKLGTEDIATIKYSPAGDELWSTIFNGKAGGSDIGIISTVDSSGNVYVAGSTDTGGFKMVYAAIKYNENGIFRWLKEYSVSPTTPEDFLYDIKVDKGNGVYVTGISFGVGTDYDIATIKYSQTISIQQEPPIISSFVLHQNYPNPFNSQTVINFSVYKPGYARVTIYNSLGESVKTLINSTILDGNHKAVFNAEELSSGIYFYKLEAWDSKGTGYHSEAKKMLLLK